MNKSVEITMYVELFSTFFEKITLSHPQQDDMMKRLSQFKQFLYGNQGNLTAGYSYLDTLKNATNLLQGPSKQLAPHNQPSNQSKQSRGRQPSIQQIESKRLLSTGDSQPQQTISQTSHNMTSNTRDSNKNSNSGNINTLNTILSGKSTGIDNITRLSEGPEQLSSFDPSALTDVRIFKLHQLNDFPGVRAHPESHTIQSNLAKYGSAREFVSDMNSSYRCIIFRYLEWCCVQRKESKLQEIFNLVHDKKIELRSQYMMDGENARDNLRKKMCGYLKHLITLVQSNRPSPSIIETLYQMVNGDNIFDAAISSFLKEWVIYFIKDMDTALFRYACQAYLTNFQSEAEALNDWINLIRSVQEPNEVIFKLVAGALDLSIFVQNVDHTGGVIEKVYDFNSFTSKLTTNGPVESNNKSIHLLCSKSSYSVVYHLLYLTPTSSYSNTNTSSNHQKDVSERNPNNQQSFKYAGSFHINENNDLNKFFMKNNSTTSANNNNNNLNNHDSFSDKKDDLSRINPNRDQHLSYSENPYLQNIVTPSNNGISSENNFNYYFPNSHQQQQQQHPIPPSQQRSNTPQNQNFRHPNNSSVVQNNSGLKIQSSQQPQPETGSKPMGNNRPKSQSQLNNQSENMPHKENLKARASYFDQMFNLFTDNTYEIMKNLEMLGDENENDENDRNADKIMRDQISNYNKSTKMQSGKLAAEKFNNENTFSQYYQDKAIKR